MSALIDAIQDVRADVVAGCSPAEAVVGAAEAYGLNPQLVARKAVESFGDLETLADREGERARRDAADGHRADVAAARKARARQVYRRPQTPEQARRNLDRSLLSLLRMMGRIEASRR